MTTLWQGGLVLLAVAVACLAWWVISAISEMRRNMGSVDDPLSEKLKELARTYRVDGNMRKGAWDQYHEVTIDGKRFLPGPDHVVAFLCAMEAARSSGGLMLWPVIRDYDGNPVQTDPQFIARYLREVSLQVPPTVVIEG